MSDEMIHSLSTDCTKFTEGVNSSSTDEPKSNDGTNSSSTDCMMSDGVINSLSADCTKFDEGINSSSPDEPNSDDVINSSSIDCPMSDEVINSLNTDCTKFHEGINSSSPDEPKSDEVIDSSSTEESKSDEVINSSSTKESKSDEVINSLNTDYTKFHEGINSSSPDEPKSEEVINSSSTEKPKMKEKEYLQGLYLKILQWKKQKYGEDEAGNGQKSRPTSLKSETVEHKNGLGSASSGCVDVLKDDPRVSDKTESESRNSVIEKIHDETELQMRCDVAEKQNNIQKPGSGPCTHVPVPLDNPCLLKVVQQHKNGLFSVQRVEQLFELLDLEKTMLSFYLEAKSEHCPFLRYWDLVNNGFYAFYHKKMRRYIRVKFSGNPTSRDYIPTICLIDYGQYEIFALEHWIQPLQLRPLKKCFFSLPMQGYTASPASEEDILGAVAGRRGHFKVEGQIVRANVFSCVKEDHSTFPHLKLKFI